MTRAWLLIGLLTLAGCSGPDAEPDAAALLPSPVPLPECPDADYSTCDIREGPCQTRLAELAACVRQSDPLGDLPIELLSEAEFAALAMQDYGDTPEPPIKYYDRAVATFGLAPVNGTTRAGNIQAQVEDLLGVYRTAEKRIVIIDHGDAADTPQIDVVLVHEAVHALQDADYDLLHWPSDEAPTFDAAMAQKTVIEGEARFYEYRVAVPLLGLDIAEVDLESTFQEHLDFMLTKAFDSDSLLRRSLTTVPYGLGAIQTFRAWQAGGPRGMDALWASPPTNMQQVMAQIFGENTPQASGVEIAQPQVEDLIPYTHDVLGAWGLNLMLSKALGKSSISQALAWRGDHLWVYTDADTSTLTYALWQLELESPAAAEALDSFFRDFFGSFSQVLHETAGSRVYVSYSADNLGASAELTAWGKAWLSGG